MNYRPVLDEKLKDLTYKYRDYSLAQIVFMLMRIAKTTEFKKSDLLQTTDLDLLNAIAPLERELEKESIISKIEKAESLYDDDTTSEDLKEKIYTDIEELEFQLEQLNKQK